MQNWGPGSVIIDSHIRYVLRPLRFEFGDVDLCDDLIGFDQITFAHEHLDQATGGLDRRIHLDGLDPAIGRHQPCGRADMPTLPPQWD